MQFRLLSLAAIAILTLTGFTGGCRKAPAVPTDTQSIDEQTIRESEVAWAQAYAAKNIDRIVAQYADD